MMNGVLAFDLGTSGVKATLYNEEGALLGAKIVNYPLYCSADGKRREQEPMRWWYSVCEASRALMAETDARIVGIGLSGHSLGIVPVDAEGQLLCNRTPIWSDARAAPEAEAFFARKSQKEWYLHTGCGFAPALYPLFKLGWMRDNEPEIYRNARYFLGTKDFVNLCMTGVPCTDRSYASGSGAYDLHIHEYLPSYCDLAGIDAEKLPPIRLANEVIGELTRAAAEQMGLKPGIPIVAGGVDNACMCLGAGCHSSGSAYASLGTSAWVAVAADSPCLDWEKRIYTFEHCVDGLYVPAAGIYSSGSSLNWAVNHLFAGLSKEPWAQVEELAKQSPVGANGVIFCPALAGGAYVDASTDLMGGFYNLNLGISRSDLIRCVFEGLCCELALAYDSLVVRVPLDGPLLLAGGGAKNDLWCQMYADVFAVSVYRTPVMQNAASLGAAALVWMGLGRWKDYSMLDKAHAQRTLFTPDAERTKQYRAVRTRFWKACQLQAQLNSWEKGKYGSI